MIQRDPTTIEQSVWRQLIHCAELNMLTLEQAKHVVDLAAQLIRWREQEIADSLQSKPAPPNCQRCGDTGRRWDAGGDMTECECGLRQKVPVEVSLLNPSPMPTTTERTCDIDGAPGCGCCP